MKKSILISSLIAAGILGGTATMLIGSADAKTSQNNNNLLAEVPAIAPVSLSSSKNETVYVITDQAGNAKSKFIGSNIYNGAEELPFDYKITYYLDDKEIGASDLKGKSGHIKIVYSYDSTANYLGKNIPFIALTGLTLNRANFSNIKLQNGKIVTETSDNYIITGYGIAGLNANLGTDFLPDSFTIEADATNFTLSDSYTIFTNELIAEFDTSKLNSIDNLTSSIYQLSDALDQILAGSAELSDGLSTALDGAKTLYAGSQELASGLNELSSRSEELTAGAEQIAALAPDIAELLQDKKASLAEQKASLEANLENIPDLEPYAEIRAQITAGIAQIDAGINKINASLAKLSDLNIFYQGLTDYTNGVAKAANGATALSAGLGSLVEGETKLYEGSVTLKNGLSTFKTSGIDKLVKFAANDLTNFTANLRSSVSAAASYHNFGSTDATSVKFIVKTPSI